MNERCGFPAAGLSLSLSLSLCLLVSYQGYAAVDHFDLPLSAPVGTTNQTLSAAPFFSRLPHYGVSGLEVVYRVNSDACLDGSGCDCLERYYQSLAICTHESPSAWTDLKANVYGHLPASSFAGMGDQEFRSIGGALYYHARQNHYFPRAFNRIFVTGNDADYCITSQRPDLAALQGVRHTYEVNLTPGYNIQVPQTQGYGMFEASAFFESYDGAVALDNLSAPIFTTSNDFTPSSLLDFRRLLAYASVYTHTDDCEKLYPISCNDCSCQFGGSKDDPSCTWFSYFFPMTVLSIDANIRYTRHVPGVGESRVWNGENYFIASPSQHVKMDFTYHHSYNGHAYYGLALQARGNSGEKGAIVLTRTNVTPQAMLQSPVDGVWSQPQFLSGTQNTYIGPWPSIQSSFAYNADYKQIALLVSPADAVGSTSRWHLLSNDIYDVSPEYPGDNGLRYDLKYRVYSDQLQLIQESTLGYRSRRPYRGLDLAWRHAFNNGQYSLRVDYVAYVDAELQSGHETPQAWYYGTVGESQQIHEVYTQYQDQLFGASITGGADKYHTPTFFKAFNGDHASPMASCVNILVFRDHMSSMRVVGFFTP